MSFLSIDRGNTDSSVDVCLSVGKFQVSGISASVIAAKMIYLSVFTTDWNRFDDSCEGRQCFCCSVLLLHLFFQEDQEEVHCSSIRASSSPSASPGSAYIGTAYFLRAEWEYLLFLDEWKLQDVLKEPL